VRPIHEYVAVYQTQDGNLVEFPLVKDAERAYRLSTSEGLLPIRYCLSGNLEFVDYRLADGTTGGQKEEFMRLLFVPPPKPASCS
jgi:hypothetical protein